MKNGLYNKIATSNKILAWFTSVIGKSASSSSTSGWICFCSDRVLFPSWSKASYMATRSSSLSVGFVVSGSPSPSSTIEYVGTMLDQSASYSSSMSVLVFLTSGLASSSKYSTRSYTVRASSKYWHVTILNLNRMDCLPK